MNDALKQNETQQQISWRVGGFLLVLLAGLLLLSRNHPDPDLWGHVQYGRDLLQEGLPTQPTYTYNAGDQRWINHEHLSELVLAFAAERGGSLALLSGKLMLGLLLLTLLIRRMDRLGVQLPVMLGCVLLSALNLMYFWNLRPHLLSYVLFATLIFGLDRAILAPGKAASSSETFQGLNARRLLKQMWWLVPWFVVWVNTHGAFLAGLAVLGLYVFATVICASFERRRIQWSLAGAATCLWSAAAGATLANPYGIGLHHWLLNSLSIPRPEILEWRPPELMSVVWVPWWGLLAVSAWALWFTRQPRQAVQLVVMGAVLWQAVSHRRHIPFYTILFAFWMPAHVQSAWQRCFAAAKASPSPPGKSTALPRLASALPAIAVLLLLCGMLHAQLSSIPVHRNEYPVSAFQFMQDQQLSGRLVTRFKWAQYAIAALNRGTEGQRVELAFDGRFRTCYSQIVVDMYFDFAVGDGPHRYRGPGPIADPTRILQHNEPDLVLLDRRQKHAVDVIHAQSGWVLLYQDATAQLWGREAIFGQASSARYLPPEQRRISDQPQVGFVNWPAYPAPRRSLTSDRDPHTDSPGIGRWNLCKTRIY